MAEQQVRVDTVVDEFKRHHLFFLPELGDMQTLLAATARARGEGEEPSGVGNKAHEHNDTNYQEEHLDIKITQAFPDQEGQYHTPTIQLTPEKIYTYKTLYSVDLGDKSVKVTATKVEENNPERVPSEVDPAFVTSLAKRLGGRVSGKGIIVLP
jgi:hypothetical protein